MNNRVHFIQPAAAFVMLFAAQQAFSAQQLWPQSENAYINKQQQSPQWIESHQKAQQVRPPQAYYAPPAAPNYGYPQQNYAPNYNYAPAPYGNQPYYPQQNNRWNSMPFMGNNRGGWPNGNWGNWNMPNMNMPDMNMPDMSNMPMSNMPFSNMPSPSFDLPSPSFTVPNMPMPFWN